MWTNSTDSLSAASSFSSFADLQSQIELNVNGDESDDNNYSQNTLAASGNIFKK